MKNHRRGGGILSGVPPGIVVADEVEHLGDDARRKPLSILFS
jgi:hypothetical protein